MQNTGQCPGCRAVNSYSATKCIDCGARLPWADIVDSVQRQATAAAPVTSAPAFVTADSAPPSNMLAALGGLMLVGGFLGAMYFFLFFDVSVAIPQSSFMGMTIGGGRVANLDLMSQRQNGIIFGLGAAVLGAMIVGYCNLRKGGDS